MFFLHTSFNAKQYTMLSMCVHSSCCRKKKLTKFYIFFRFAQFLHLFVSVNFYHFKSLANSNITEINLLKYSILYSYRCWFSYNFFSSIWVEKPNNGKQIIDIQRCVSHTVSFVLYLLLIFFFFSFLYVNFSLCRNCDRKNSISTSDAMSRMNQRTEQKSVAKISNE